MMSELLARYTSLPVVKAENETPVEADHIYLIPPRKNMTIKNRKLFLTEQAIKHSPNLPIDIFFRSLAADIGNKAIGIVLSGTGSDGTMGIKAIKEHEGMIMAQSSETAKFDGMPRSAADTGMVDFILPPEQMPVAILNYVRHPFIVKPKKQKKKLTSDDYLLHILKIVNETTGVDFTYYKPNTIIRRLEKRLGINQINTYEEYVNFLENSTRESYILYKDLLIGVTQFFRDQKAFEILSEKLIPELLEKKKTKEPFRVWCAGCSTGEEAYSLAILIAECMQRLGIEREVKLFATDLDKEHVEDAGIGFYPASIVADVSIARLSKYFLKTEHGYQVNEDIRRMVIFAQQNIIKDPPFSKLDLITCRNLLIYLNPEVQRKVVSMFYFALRENGGLFLGSSETLGDIASGFETLDHRWKIFRKTEGYKPPDLSDLLPMVSGHTHYKNALQSRTNTRHGSESTVDNLLSGLLESVLPPTVIINQHFQVVHVINDVNDFISIPTGKVSFDIFSLARKDLSLVLNSILNKVFKDDKKVSFRDFNLKNRKKPINIYARPLQDPFSKQKFVSLSFEWSEVSKETPERNKFDLKTELNERNISLEKELQYTKENLQATIEELETSNEELQSTNEELIASNEELQSTNEELQSVNEELYTVNSEFQNKIDELTELNNDINNLLRNTNIGILYLDRKLHIRKFTKLITRIINLIDLDIGRPISDISINLDYKGFLKDITKVRDTLALIEKELQGDDGKWNLIRIQPYRTAENAVEGVTVTVIDITTRKEDEIRLRETDNRLKLAMEAGKLGWWEWDMKSGRVLAGDKKSTMLNLDPDETERFSVEDWISLIHPEDYEHTMQQMRDHLEGKSTYYETQYRLKTGSGGYKWVHDKGSIVERSKSGQPLKLTGVVSDISVLMENKLKFQQLFLSMSLGVVYQDSDGKITAANPAAQKILGLTLDQMIGRHSVDKRWRAVREDGSDFPGEEHPAMVSLRTGKEVKNQIMGVYDPKEKKLKWILVNATPQYFDDPQTPGQVFATFLEITDEREAQQQLERNYDLFYRILENSPLGQLVLNDKGEITYTNKRAETILGVKSATILKRKYNDLNWNMKGTGGETIPDDKLPYSLVMNGKSEIKSYALMIETQKKEKRFITINGAPVYDQDKKIEGVVFNLDQIDQEDLDKFKTWKDF
ncbi:MAG: PAS domain-containing protein [Bacteroidales bacterium]|nr:PAS domain-containing protein [Bacteroidales bacterium]